MSDMGDVEPGEVRILRHQDEPPQESYEAVWRDALKILEDAGHRAGFLLLTARTVEDEDGKLNYEARCAISTGLDAILVDELVYLLTRNLEAM